MSKLCFEDKIEIYRKWKNCLITGLAKYVYYYSFSKTDKDD